MINQNLKHSFGFSLIEILIAITLLSFIAIGVINITNNSIDTQERVSTEDKNKINYLPALMRMSVDFSQAFSPQFFEDPAKLGQYTFKDFNGSEAGAENPYDRSDNFSSFSETFYPMPKFKQDGPTEIQFFTTASRRKTQDQRESNFAWIVYKLENMDSQNDEERGLFELKRYLISDNPWQNDTLDLSKYKGQSILDRIVKLEFSVWNKSKDKFTGTLKDIQESDKGIFKGIQVDFVWKSPQGYDVKITRVFRPLIPYAEKGKTTQ